MKNILNKMSEDEKQAILEQHKGGKTINTEKFARLLESKLGDVKPLTEQTLPSQKDVDIAAKGFQNYAQDKMGSTAPTEPKEIPKVGNKGVGDVTGDLKGKTFVVYGDAVNTVNLGTLTIDEIIKNSIDSIVIKATRSNPSYGITEENNFDYSCAYPNKLTEIIQDPQNTGRPKSFDLYSNRFTAELKKRFCATSTGGSSVPNADFTKTSTSSSTMAEQSLPQTTPTPTQKITGLGDVTGDLKGKTVNFYEDEANKYLRFTLKIIKIIKEEVPRLQIVMDWGTSGQEGENPDYFYFFCEDGNFISNRGSEQETLFSNNFAKELKKRFCDVSAGGAEVPAADFVQP